MEIFLNRVYATLAAGIDAVAVSMTLTTGQGVRFGTIEAGSKVRVAMIDAANNVSEIIYVTAITGDTLTIVRAQDGSTAATHLAGDRIEARIGKSTLDSFTQKSTAGTDAIAEAHAASSKITPVDADELPLADSASTFSLKKFTWLNIKTALKTYLDGYYNALYAPLSSPALTGTPTAPTPATADNSTAIATTAFVAGTQISNDARYAALLGNTANKFSVAAGVAATDAVNVGQANDSYLGGKLTVTNPAIVSGTTYTNSTSNIKVVNCSFSANGTGSVSSYMKGYVNGVLQAVATMYGYNGGVTLFVPAGQTYKFTWDTNGGVQSTFMYG
jgi:hypothetical protein